MTKKCEIPASFDPVCSVRAVCSMLAGVHEDTLAAWVKAGKLPPPIRLSNRTVGWRRSTVEKFIADAERGAESAGA